MCKFCRREILCAENAFDNVCGSMRPIHRPLLVALSGVMIISGVGSKFWALPVHYGLLNVMSSLCHINACETIDSALSLCLNGGERRIMGFEITLARMACITITHCWENLRWKCLMRAEILYGHDYALVTHWSFDYGIFDRGNPMYSSIL